MNKNRIMQIIENYGNEFDPAQDMNMAEAMSIIDSSKTRMEIAENAYLYGHMRGSYDGGLTRQVPTYNLQQMTDEEWAELARKSKLEREVSV